MISRSDAQRIKAQVLVWWICWVSILGGLVVIYLFLGRGPPKPAAVSDLPVNLSGVVPLFVSIIIRWLVLPRSTKLKSAFAMFITGLVLAEACGMLGIFLGGPYRDSLCVLGVLGVTQYMPFYARRFFEPRSSGFIPKN
ncbi:MAG: hypothetical protein EXS42_01560 [Lacunisphaera sp.]|nr:hypothetical protein [Lacunisphaera sp.]